MKKILAILLLAVSTSAFADCGQGQFFKWGQPTVTDGKPRQELCRIAYFTLWDPSTKNPTYSAELLIPENVSGEETRATAFYNDPNVRGGSKNSDFVKTGYDKGHLAPAGDFRATTAMMEQSFYLTNMAPQFSTLNRREWANLEKQVRKMVRADRPVYVITGVSYAGYASATPPTIGNGVAIPRSFYKVIYDPISLHLACYSMPNEDGVSGKLEKYFVSCAQVQTSVGVTFFPQLPASVKLQELPIGKGW